MLEIVRSDRQGRIVIPKWIRKAVQFPNQYRDEALFGISLLPSGEIILQPLPQSCHICGSEEALHYWDERKIHLCSSCCEQLDKKLNGLSIKKIKPRLLIDPS